MSAVLGPHIKHSRRNPCPTCGGDNCVTFEDGATLCLRIESPHRTKTGIGWLHPNGDASGDWRDRLPRPGPSLSPSPSPDPATLDRALRRLLVTCPLSAAHRADLLDRGLTAAQVAALPFGSLPAAEAERDRVAADLVAAIGPGAYSNVPGLFAGENGAPRLNAHAGLLIGVADRGRLVGMKIRPNDAAVREDGKYRWLSSGDKPGGVGSGAPCGVIFPVGWVASAPVDRVAAVEGILKGYVVANRLGLPVVAIPGATVTADVVDLVRQLGATEVITSYDNDRHTNPHVARAEATLIADLLAAGVTVLRATWPAPHKGLDDALAAGLLPIAEPVIDCAELRAENARLRAELAQARDLYRAHLAAIRSPNLGAERVTAAAIVADLAHVPAGEWVPMGHKRIATNAGVSESVAPKHVERIKPALAGAVEIVKRWIPESLDPETGVLTGGHHQNFARRLVPATEALAIVARAPASAAGKRNGHGGERSCQRCGGTKITRHWADKCDECGHVVAAGKTCPEAPPATPDSPKFRMALGNYQDGGFSDAPPDGDPKDDDIERSSSDDVPITAELTTGHNDEPPWLDDAPDDFQIEVDLDPVRVRDILAGVEHATDPDDFREANAVLGDQLAAIAQARGRQPVPKPRRWPQPPHRGEAGDDAWTF